MKRLTMAAAAMALVAMACGGDDTSSESTTTAASSVTTAAPTTEAPATEAPTTTAATTETPTTTATTTEAPVAGSVVTVAASSLGDILVDGAGNSLYLFVPDAQGASTCTGGCAEAWPPFTESVEAGNGIDAALLGTVAREDGTTQVTYNGWPLYYFAADGALGDTNGQGVNDVWFVIDAVGNAIP